MEHVLPLLEHTLAQLTQTRREVGAQPTAVEAVTGPARVCSAGVWAALCDGFA